MYSSLKKRVSSTKSGTYKNNNWCLDFQRLPWTLWMDTDPLTRAERLSLKGLYPILLQEIHTKKPSKLLHFLCGRGVLFWQDVVVIQHGRQTDMERNSPLLEILLTRGQDGLKALLDGLRSRYGGWQGYLADLIEMKCDVRTVKHLLDIFKIVCHDLVKANPLGWAALPRKLGVKCHAIEQNFLVCFPFIEGSPQSSSGITFSPQLILQVFVGQCRRQNKLVCNQLLHTLFIWMGQKSDEVQLLGDLVVALHKIGRSDIADGLSVLIRSISVRSLSRQSTTNSSPTQDRFGGDTPFSEQRDDVNSETQSQADDEREYEPVEQGNPRSPRISEAPKPKRRPKRARTSPQRRYIKKVEVGNVYEYAFSGQGSATHPGNRSPSILQLDYMTQRAFDNMFIDYLTHN